MMTGVFPWRTGLAWIVVVLLGVAAGITFLFGMRRRGIMPGDRIMARAEGILGGAEAAQARAEYEKAKELEGVSDADLVARLHNAGDIHAVIDSGRERIRRVLDATGPGGRTAEESRREIAGLRGEITDLRGAIAAARAHRSRDG